MTNARFPKLAGAALIGLAGASCTAGYIYETYGTTPPTLVTVECHTTYEVYDNPKDRTLMVRTNAFAEIADAICRERAARRVTPERAAEVFLSETTSRPQCRIVESRKLSGLHWEFRYACPG